MRKLPLKPEWIERIFMRLHGRLGNQFFDKFRIGILNANGEDAGIVNAKAIWAEELAGLSPEQILAGLDATYHYPPSCDDFRANCVVKKPVNFTQALPRKFTDEEMAKNRARTKALLAGFLSNTKISNRD